MKKRASGILKLIAAVRAMAKSKALALKSRTNAMKARLVIFSLVMNKRYVMSTISDKFQSLGHHHHHSRVKEVQDVVDSVENKCTVVVNDSAHLSEVVSDVVPGETLVVVEDKNDYDYDDGECECYNDDEYDDDDDGNKYPDLTHTMFESEDSDIGGSVIEMVKSSKEEAGQEFKMEDEIDHMADLFIRKFRRQILLQKQDSLNRNNEMQKLLES
ncbi:hypothetical protein LR48_Vigan10g189900 [Vigna angularis]|uniref:Uncharacterized protein n=2 Tax=Phaseolus angularis TaxID=3914 RepID=A0A0L9VMA7_PHAAN|nr:uncharacterized protein LOC108345320 [Vigna angularis]KAG2384453.1 uncharacterized protein HKW66_Vig0147830 [Vigna angularis]KOM56007.1 hypothetical protein LR48_Vigan10g189900 [Vigna angularis]BAU01768.1 hypothetical protein VIGAN_11107200 [Vigna angularis var. angularis]